MEDQPLTLTSELSLDAMGPALSRNDSLPLLSRENTATTSVLEPVFSRQNTPLFSRENTPLFHRDNTISSVLDPAGFFCREPSDRSLFWQSSETAITDPSLELCPVPSPRESRFLQSVTELVKQDSLFPDQLTQQSHTAYEQLYLQVEEDRPLVQALVPSMEENLKRLSGVVPLDEDTKCLAKRIANSAVRLSLGQNKQHKSLSGAALWLACVLQGKKVTQANFCQAIQLTEVTLRKVYKELVQDEEGRVVWTQLCGGTYTPVQLPKYSRPPVPPGPPVPANTPAGPAGPAVPAVAANTPAVAANPPATQGSQLAQRNYQHNQFRSWRLGSQSYLVPTSNPSHNTALSSCTHPIFCPRPSLALSADDSQLVPFDPFTNQKYDGL